MTLLALNDIKHRFGDHAALKGVSCSVNPGEVMALLGANGGGKTTLMRLIAGVLPLQKGEGHVLGTDVRESRNVRARVGYMAQQLSLPPHLTMAETLTFHADLYDIEDRPARITEMIERFNLGPHLKTRVSALSGGWARRLQMAASLIHNPSLILLDEPTVGLDAVARQDLWGEISRLADTGAAVVIATHDHHEATRADHGIFLMEGEAAARGTPEDMAASAPGAVLAGTLTAPLSTFCADSGVFGARRDGDTLRAYVKGDKADALLAANPKLERVATSLSDAAYLFVAHKKAEFLESAA